MVAGYSNYGPAIYKVGLLCNNEIVWQITLDSPDGSWKNTKVVTPALNSGEYKAYWEIYINTKGMGGYLFGTLDIDSVTIKSMGTSRSEVSLTSLGRIKGSFK